MPPIAASIRKSRSCELRLAMPACSPVAPGFLLLFALRFCALFALAELLAVLFWFEFWPLMLTPAFPAITQSPHAKSTANTETKADFINCCLPIHTLLAEGGVFRQFLMIDSKLLNAGEFTI